MLGIALALALQAPTLTVTTAVDRTRVGVGEEIIYTVQAQTTTPGGFRVELPNLSGLEVVERTERTDRVAGGAPNARLYVLEVRYRAAEIGTWQLAPTLVFVGSETQVAPDASVTVVGSSGSSETSAGNPRVLALIQRVPPPVAGGPSVSVIVSASSLYSGEQLDLLTAAWFPRGVRARLRRAPTLKPPVVDGVWSVPQSQLSGIIATRAIGEEIYDLFINHQVIFPLAPGRVVVPPARLSYGLPTSRPAGGEERAIDQFSDSVAVTVLPLPQSTAPGTFTGPVARNLEVTYRVRDLPARAGTLLPVELVIQGQGNLTLWTPPAVEWPPGVRAYTDKVEEVPHPAGGRQGGTKVFRFLLLPDSAGSIALGALSYPYFDPELGRYLEATTGGMVIPVVPSTDTVTRRDPVPLAADPGRWPAVVAAARPGLDPGWIGAAVAPLVMALGSIGWRVFRRRQRRSRTTPDPLAEFERTVDRLAHVGDPNGQGSLTAALRRVGLGRDLGTEMARAKHDVDAARFGPAPGPVATRTSDLHRLLTRIPNRLKRLAGLVLLIAIGTASGGASGRQDPNLDPRTLYHTAQYAAAAKGFADTARRTPGDWTAWYNVAAASYMRGRDAEAAAALIRSLDQAPRAKPSRALWQTLAREYEPLHNADVPGPVAVGEWWLLALGTWWLAGLAVLFRRRARWVSGLGVAAGLAAGFAIVTAAHRAEPSGFVRAGATIRLSPHGLATERGTIPAIDQVRLVARRGEWVRVRDARRVEGWLPAEGVAVVHDLD